MYCLPVSPMVTTRISDAVPITMPIAVSMNRTFCSNKVRFMLTAIGMVIGTASLILVVTIGLTGKQYILNQIQGIGANEIYAEYEGGAQRITNATQDPLTVEDLTASMQQVSGIVAASPVVTLADRISV